MIIERVIENNDPNQVIQRKITPKQFAIKIIIDNLDSCNYWDEQWPDQWDLMTERERNLVNDQLHKILERIIKRF